MEQPDRAPKPKLSKAERRELQERQRAAKLAKSSPDKVGNGAPGSGGVKAAQSSSPHSAVTQSKVPSQVILDQVIQLSSDGSRSADSLELM